MAVVLAERRRVEGQERESRSGGARLRARRGVRPDAPDAALLGARREVAKAFEFFYRRHHVHVLRMIARRTCDTEVALDLTAEVFAAAYLQRLSFDPERGSARNWLAAIARHKVVDHYRRDRGEASARERLGIERRQPSDAALAEAEALLAAAAMVDELPPIEREAVWARVIKDREYADMARAAGRSPATMRKRVSDGLARLGARGAP